jgi:hypothetical protein
MNRYRPAAAILAAACLAFAAEDIEVDDAKQIKVADRP